MKKESRKYIPRSQYRRILHLLPIENLLGDRRKFSTTFLLFLTVLFATLSCLIKLTFLKSNGDINTQHGFSSVIISLNSIMKDNCMKFQEYSYENMKFWINKDEPMLVCFLFTRQ